MKPTGAKTPLLLIMALALLAAPACKSATDGKAPAAAAGPAAPPPPAWIPLFNGRDLEGWIPKIKGYALGDNHADTFRVDNGVLKVSYDKYQKFDSKFGHLAYHKPFSHYRLRVEYRFVGDQCPGGPDWAFRNSGAMLHGQAPETMEKDQDFPVSIEAQFLGGRGTGNRSTANLCSPGTHVVMDGKLVTRHCNDSRSKTYHGDQWVTVEFEVRGGRSVKHIVEGEAVLEYTEPQLDDGDAQAKKILAANGGKKLVEGGYIYLQAESHPIEFRKVELLPLDPAEDPAPAPTATAPNTLTDEEKRDGWRLLFDGSTLTGWRSARGDVPPGKVWSVGDGELRVGATGGGESRDGGDIVTRETFSSFVLKVEFKMTPGANSGIKYFVDPELNKGQGSAIGLEYQILDDERHPDAKQGRNANRTLASLYDLIPAAAGKKPNPIGQWNQAMIVSRGQRCEHWLNGEKVVEYERGSKAYRDLVAISKYKVWPGFGERPAGHLLLQEHGAPVVFRNIKIKVLPAP